MVDTTTTTEIVEIGRDGYDAKVWVNRALQTHENTEIPVLQLASALVAKLQSQFQEVCQSLDETTDATLDNIPRVLRDIDTIKLEAKTLNDRLLLIRKDIERVESETAQSIACLSSVDQVKDKMTKVENALHHVDYWTMLTKELDTQWENLDHTVISDKVSSIKKALNSLQCLPDYEDRKKKLEEYEERLEKMIKPVLIQIHNDNDIDELDKVIAILISLDRKEILKETYYNCKKGPKLSSWKALANDFTADGKSTIPIDKTAAHIQDILNKFHEQLIKMLQVEIPYILRAFDIEAKSVECQLLVEIYSNMSPTILSLLTKFETGHRNPNLQSLALNVQLQQITANLANSVSSLLRGSDQFDEICIPKLFNALYSPFVPAFLSYQTIQTNVFREFLSSKFENSPLSNNYMDTVNRIYNSVEVCFTFINSNLETCIKVTSGLGGAQYLKALNAALHDFISFLKRSIKHCHDLSLKSGKGQVQDEHYQTQDWSHFNGALTVLRACGVLIQQFRSISTEGRLKLERQAMSISKKKNTDLSCFCNWLVIDAVKEARFPLGLNNAEGLREDDVSWGHILNDSRSRIQELNDVAHRFTFDILFSHISQSLETISSLPAWKEGSKKGGNPLNLPSFSLSQQNYISQIGQQLLDLPQQLELFVKNADDDDASNLHVALAAGSLPYVDEDNGNSGSEDESHYANRWLEAIILRTMFSYRDKLVKIPLLTDMGAKQLAVDIEYFANILSVLDIPLLQDLEHILKLSKTPTNELEAVINQSKSDKNLQLINDRFRMIRK